jgi:nucleotide-binding universal stress UspA family protein
MSFATVMVHVGLDTSSDSRIRLASRLAERFKSMLIGVAATVPPPPAYSGDFVGDYLSEDELTGFAARLERRGAEFRVIAGKHQSKIEWRSDIDFADDVLAREARAGDLVVIGRDRATGDEHGSLDPGTAILKTGRPVLVVPPALETLRAERVVIGWKDAREARRAVQDALPFLHEARRVSIVEICEQDDENEVRRHLDDLARYLTRHRITVGAPITAHAKTEADALVNIAGEQGADLVVTGAYGHTRLGEWIFGGVTRDLLAKAPICCLMSH